MRIRRLRSVMARKFRLVPADLLKSLMEQYENNSNVKSSVLEIAPSVSIKVNVQYGLLSVDYEKILPLSKGLETSFAPTLPSSPDGLSDKSLLRSMRRSMHNLLNCYMDVSEKKAIYNNALYNYLKLKKEGAHTHLKVEVVNSPEGKDNRHKAKEIKKNYCNDIVKSENDDEFVDVEKQSFSSEHCEDLSDEDSEGNVESGSYKELQKAGYAQEKKFGIKGKQLLNDQDRALSSEAMCSRFFLTPIIG